MPTRRAVSLVEVLVATVLLAVGITGTLAALASAARLREAARGRDAVAAAVRERLAWFEAVACLPETASGSLSRTDGVRVTWSLSSDTVSALARRTAVVRAERGPAGRRQHLTVHVARPCV